LAGAPEAESCPAGYFSENCHARCNRQVKIRRLQVQILPGPLTNTPVPKRNTFDTEASPKIKGAA
jgi:hypothetical protein